MDRAEEIFARIVEQGESALDDFIRTRKSEELFLDFKRSADDGQGNVLDQKDRDNLAKAISGFGNSEGGVIVWGIDCSKDKDGADVARMKRPIRNVKRFVSLLEGVISGCTLPPQNSVRNHPIELSNGDGFVATFIGKSFLPPVRAVSQKQYYIRAGSSFEPVPHDVLAAMFGRRPQPKLIINFVHKAPAVTESGIDIEIGFLLRNKSPVFAKDLYFHIWIFSLLGPNCQSKLDMANAVNEKWICRESFGSMWSCVSPPGYRLAPQEQVMPLLWELRLSPPFHKDLKVEIVFGSENSPCRSFEFRTPASEVERLGRIYNEQVEHGIFVGKNKDDFIKRLLNMPAADQL